MASLRKACRSCTSSKRKCVVQLPKCTRCAQKGIECSYDLEPLKAATGLLRHPDVNHDYYGYCVMKRVESNAASDIDPAVCKPRHEDALMVVRLGYQAVPDLLRAGQPAVFVHPKLQLHGSYNHCAVFTKEPGKGDADAFERLIELDVKTVPVREALTALQALLVYLATFLFPADHSVEPETERFFTSLLSEWTQSLLATAQTRMPRNQSPWQEWLFGESVRRTIVMSYALVLALSSFNHGYCSNWLFVESLPFDKRVGLWMAESPQAWIAAARARTGDEVGEQLNSFHEFGESLDGSDQTFCGDSFLALLAFGHNGKKSGAT